MSLGNIKGRAIYGPSFFLVISLSATTQWFASGNYQTLSGTHYDDQRFFLLAWLFALSASVIFFPRRLSKYISVALLAIFSLPIISSTHSSQALLAHLELAQWWLLATSIIGLSAMWRENPNRQLVTRTIAIFYIGLFIIMAAWIWSNILIRLLHPYGSTGALTWHHPFENSRYLSHILTWTLPAAPLPFFVTPKNRSVFYEISLLFCIGSALGIAIISASRGTFASLLVAQFFLISAFGTKKYIQSIITHRIKLIGIITTAVVTTLVFEVAWDNPHNTSLGHLARTGFSGRLELWMQSWNLFINEPLHGQGPMHFALSNNTTSGSPHNLIALLASEIGFIGFILAALASYWIIKEAKRARKALNKNNPLSCFLLAAIAAGFTHSQFSAIYSTPPSIFLFCITLGTYLGTVNIHNLKERKQPNQVGTIIIVQAVFVFALSALAAAYSAVANIQFKECWADTYEKPFFSSYKPRYWLNGKLEHSNCTEPELQKFQNQ